VFKIVMAAAGLTEGLIRPQDRVYCRGSTTIYNHRFHCGRRTGHGWVNLEEALERSCNIYFYQLGEKLGIETIARYARMFGLGSPTGIDLEGEAVGLVPDSAWSLQARGHRWYPGETISLAVGQGPLLVTPLQVARMTAAVANGGRLVIPRLVRGTTHPPAPQVGIEPEVLARIRQGLTAVVNRPQGTAYWFARMRGVTVAGKTGTAQVVRGTARDPSEEVPYEERPHAWFASFAPADAPELVVVVFVEHGGAGSAAAAPIAKALYEIYFQAGVRRVQAL
jgi:penicillin-binding protein 2